MSCNYLCGILLFLVLTLIIIFVRVIYLILQVRCGKHSQIKRNNPVNVIICIGSGGHTTEMIKLLEKIDQEKYYPRHYVMASSDAVSEEKIICLEKQVYKSKNDYNIMRIPRSRVVNQSYLTSIFTTFHSILYCLPIYFKIKPDLILCNGPGTCIPICIIAFIMKVFYLNNTKIIFIESICRVETLSLSGRILSYFADNIVVQWEDLRKVYSRVDYLGQLF